MQSSPLNASRNLAQAMARNIHIRPQEKQQ
jgi:hypothetical protein